LRVPLVTAVTADSTLSRFGGATPRSTPSCWPLMMIAFGSLLIGLSARPWKSPISFLTRAVALSVVTLASLMTQSRTLLVGIAVCLLGAIITAKTWRTRVLLLSAGFAIPLMLTVAAEIGGSLLGQGFEDYYLKRYSVLLGLDSVSEYAPTDGRTVEIQAGLDRWSEWLWLGEGVAANYRDPIYEREKRRDAKMAHNVLLYFGTRFGLLGIALFLVFCGVVCSLLYRASHSPRRYNAVALCLGVDLVSLLVTAMFGNVFAMPYMSQVAMVAFGCLVAWAVWSAQIRMAPSAAWASLRNAGPAEIQQFLVPVRGLSGRSGR
jgi:O-antigen ligase